MKEKKKALTIVIFLLTIGMLLASGANKNIYAKTKKIKWTATIAKTKYAYKNKKIKPKVTVKYKGKKLPKKNYKVKYPKNPVKKGTYKIKVTLKGRYKGKKFKGTKIIKYKIYVPRKYNDSTKDNNSDENNNKKKEDVLVKKNVNGISIAYNKGQFPFGLYTDSDNGKSDGNKKKYAQCFFLIFIKQKLKNDFVIHTEYNGKCGFNNFSNRQYIPNRKDAEVASNISVYYFYDGDVKPSDELQQALYEEGYVGYIMVNVSCLLDKKQSVDLYFGDEKVITLESDKFSNLEEFDYSRYYRYDYFLEPAYSYETETTLRKILNDVSKCAPNMTDYETYSAVNYWIKSHTYSEYTCWGAIVTGEVMTELGYPYIQLACSYDDGNNRFYNDYSRYYSLRSKLDDAGYNSLGHRITLIYMKKGQFLYCEVQGEASEGTKFTFNPAGWVRPQQDTRESLWDGNEKFALNEYSTINELMKGDYEIDPYQYDAFDWHTWRNYL